MTIPLNETYNIEMYDMSGEGDGVTTWLFQMATDDYYVLEGSVDVQDSRIQMSTLVLRDVQGIEVSAEGLDIKALAHSIRKGYHQYRESL